MFRKNRIFILSKKLSLIAFVSVAVFFLVRSFNSSLHHTDENKPLTQKIDLSKKSVVSVDVKNFLETPSNFDEKEELEIKGFKFFGAFLDSFYFNSNLQKKTFVLYQSPVFFRKSPLYLLFCKLKIHLG